MPLLKTQTTPRVEDDSGIDSLSTSISEDGKIDEAPGTS